MWKRLNVVCKLSSKLINAWLVPRQGAFLLTELIANTIEGRSSPGGVLGNTFRLGWEASVRTQQPPDSPAWPRLWPRLRLWRR